MYTLHHYAYTSYTHITRPRKQGTLHNYITQSSIHILEFCLQGTDNPLVPQTELKNMYRDIGYR